MIHPLSPRGDGRRCERSRFRKCRSRIRRGEARDRHRVRRGDYDSASHARFQSSAGTVPDTAQPADTSVAPCHSPRPARQTLGSPRVAAPIQEQLGKWVRRPSSGLQCAIRTIAPSARARSLRGAEISFMKSPITASRSLLAYQRKQSIKQAVIWNSKHHKNSHYFRFAT